MWEVWDAREGDDGVFDAAFLAGLFIDGLVDFCLFNIFSIILPDVAGNACDACVAIGDEGG